MTDPLADALYSIGWGAEREESTPLSPAQCKALGEYIDQLEQRTEAGTELLPKVEGEVGS